MKIKNIGMIAAAALVVTTLAMSASASSLPENTPAGVGIASVKAVDVDVSALDFSEMLEGTPVAIGTIDPEDFPCALSTESLPADAAACLSAVEAVDFDPSAIDLGEMLVGEPVAVGAIDPASVTGGTTAQAANK